ncbi:helix-turn-helix domain-containing protein [Enterococcus sp. 669A]|uniref:Helix-turn-helix domain-containing protein n=1 Tax=Candidatus Enterococcus moelleringii TaxID=2815325 RepID=A0ABS3LGB8_9ENTE|nr:PRD domain-containing protein [Enterococcus sp. 669A]MBO1308675.1 helix-turn-helix domain-containing protein [Enterococcus sp. 669A]
MDSQTYQVLTILVNELDYVTYKTISKKINVSSRTVSRIIPTVITFLERNNFNFSVKKGRGIKLNLDENERSRLEESLVSQNVNYYSSEERIAFIITELLDSDDSAKIDYFANVLGVSPMTIHSDLATIENRMSNLNLKLCKQRGKGITVEGSKFDKAMFYSDFLYGNIDVRLIEFTQANPFSIIMFGNHLSSSIREKLYKKLPIEEMRTIHSRFEKSGTRLRFLLADGGYFKLVLTTSLLNRNSESTTEYSKKYNDLVEEIIDISLSQSKKIVSEEEAEFIDRYISSARKTNNTEKWSSKFSVSENFEEEINRVRSAFYRIFGNKIDMTSVFIKSFDNHVYLFLQRYNSNLQVKNQYTHIFKEEYPQIFIRIHDLVVELGYEKIIDDEVVFLAMHILGAILDKNNSSNTKRVAVVCSSGFGTSKVLRESIKKRFPQIEIEDEYNDNIINEFEFIKKNIDLIVSTIPVDTIFVPNVMVNPFLSQNDVIKIENILNLKNSDIDYPVFETDNSIEKIPVSNERTRLIDRVLETFYFSELSEVESIDQVIEEISAATMPADKAPLLAEALKEREKFGSSVIDDHGVLLLHCKFDDQIQLGVIRIDRPVEYHTIDGLVKIDTIILMVVPTKKRNEIVQLFGTISSSLVLDENFLKSVKSLDFEKLSSALRSSMEKMG